MKRYCLLLAAALLLPLSGCKKEMPKNFAAMPDVLSDDELNIADNEPSYKCIESHYKNGELEEKKERLYDEHDHIISEDNLDIVSGEPKPAMYGKSVNEYDSDGNLVKSIWYYSDEKTVYTVFINTYDENGNQTSITVYYDYDGHPQKHSYYEMKYDEHGNETEWFEVKANNSIGTVCKYSYEYDDKGNITKKTEDKSYSKDKIIEHTYTYDDDGNMLTETSVSISRKSGKQKSDLTTWTYEYDISGNLIRKVSDSVDEKGRVETTYEYDEKGRQIKCTSINGYNTVDVTEYEYEDLKLAD